MNMCGVVRAPIPRPIRPSVSSRVAVAAAFWAFIQLASLFPTCLVFAGASLVLIDSHTTPLSVTYFCTAGMLPLS